MHFVKSFFSHLFAIIIFFIILFLASTTIVRNVLVDSVIETTLSRTNYMETIKTETSKENESMEEIWEYIEIDDLVYEYLADEILFKLKITEEEPKLNLEELNERIAYGIEKYIDDKIEEYTGGFNSYLENIGIDLGTEEKVNDYINNNIGIDLTNNEIITEEDLEELYVKVDEVFKDLEESTYVYEILDIVYNDTLRIILIVSAIVLTILICVINWNAVVGITYLIAPLALNSGLFLVGFVLSVSIDVSGRQEADAINYLINTTGAESLKQFIVLLLITIFVIILYYFGKIMSIRIAHKTGKTTLDTFFDDYNSEEVIKGMQEEYEVEETYETEDVYPENIEESLDNDIEENVDDNIDDNIDKNIEESIDLDKPLLVEENEKEEKE